MEEYHLAANMLDNVVCTLKSRYEATLPSVSPRKVLWHVVEQVDDEVIAVLKVHQEVIGLGHEHVFRICANHHLGLLQSGLQVVEVHIIVVGEEGNLSSLASHSRKKLLLNHTLDRRARQCKVAALNRRL